jgi:hypothetical protein
VADRDPTPAEVDAAILATTTLVPQETLGTKRRGSASRIQEGLVFRHTSRCRPEAGQIAQTVSALDEIARGDFSRERKVGGAKCDVPIPLNDGRLLVLECKVSNGPRIAGSGCSWR